MSVNIIWFDIYTSGWQITPNAMGQREIKSNPVILQCPFDLPSEEWKYRDTETNKWIRAEENEINIACIARGLILLRFLTKGHAYFSTLKTLRGR